MIPDFMNAWRNIMGVYTPITDSNGVVYPNYEYIVLACIFALGLYWICKFFFSLFK